MNKVPLSHWACPKRSVDSKEVKSWPSELSTRVSSLEIDWFATPNNTNCNPSKRDLKDLKLVATVLIKFRNRWLFLFLAVMFPRCFCRIKISFSDSTFTSWVNMLRTDLKNPPKVDLVGFSVFLTSNSLIFWKLSRRKTSSKNLNRRSKCSKYKNTAFVVQAGLTLQRWIRSEKTVSNCQ